ncbi:MAG: outer membrane protein transport protein [Robiginitomaculum sp.]|nr:outer membrane protein transport protein [Robiginitomaculum sp.]
MTLMLKRTIRTTFVSLLAASALSVPAFATEGYFQNGTSARSKALAGAGVADTRDAAGAGINPAGLFRAGNQFQLSLSAFNPNRQFTGTGPGFTPSGVIKSGENWFPVPGLAYSRQFNDKFAWGIVLIANGGMNTSYARDLANSVCGTGPFPSATGVFCGAGTGVDLNQMFIQPTFAYKPMEGFSIGIAPVLAVQKFEARGLAAFGGASVDPANLTNNGSDWGTGLGVKLGVEIDSGSGFRFGASYQPKIIMDRFTKYRGLFADGGKFDVPSNWQVGVAFDMSEDITAMFDIRHVSYSGVPAIGNSSRTPSLFGSFGGPGFGWSNVTSYKLGVEWRRDEWTWRGGYARNNNPIGADDVTLNILAPGVTKSHITGGFSYAVNEGNSFDFALMYAPNTSVSGIEVTPGGLNPGRTIELSMNQLEVTAGWTWNF